MPGYCGNVFALPISLGRLGGAQPITGKVRFKFLYFADHLLRYRDHVGIYFAVRDPISGRARCPFAPLGLAVSNYKEHINEKKTKEMFVLLFSIQKSYHVFHFYCLYLYGLQQCQR